MQLRQSDVSSQPAQRLLRSRNRNAVDRIPLLGEFQGALRRFASPVDDTGRLRLWALTVAAAAAAVALGVAAFGPSVGVRDAGAIAVLGLLAYIAERQPVRITGNAEVTVSALPVLFAAIVFGPLAAMAVGALGLLGDFKAPYIRWLIWTSSRSLSGGMAGLVYLAVSGFGNHRSWVFIGVAAAVAVDSILDVLINAATVAIRRSGSFLGFLKSGMPVVAATVPFHSTVVALLAYAYIEVSAWTMLLFFGPAFAAHRFYRLYREQREASDQLQEANEKLERASLSFAGALVSALDARDQYTAGHSAAVAVYARDIAQRLGLDEKQVELAHLCGLLHDIGKVGLPPGLLEKPGRLTLSERRAMEEHSAIGERILKNVEDYRDISRIVRHHHERVDGNGYPDGLSLDAIPLISRIVAVADAYNAMTSGRPYREAMQSNVARLRLAQAVGTQFDITVVAAFEAVLASSGETYRSGARADFALEAQRHRDLQPATAALGT
jgi:putative nucleotidyltransferase with HDIG domain